MSGLEEPGSEDRTATGPEASVVAQTRQASSAVGSLYEEVG